MTARAMMLALAVLVGGCGPSSGSNNNGPPGCLQAQPCGGDVVGTWTFLGACTSPTFFSETNSQLQATCPGASVTAFDLGFSGTVTYNADLTYSANASETIDVTEMIPLSCLGFATCAAVVSDSPDSTLSCTGTTVCACHIRGSSPGIETGTYTVSGTNLTMVGPDHTSTDAYCVRNGQLHLMGISDTSGAVVGDIVAQKQ
jgi:hypothetical protein